MRELGIGFVAYSPLGRGFLTGSITGLDDLADDDFRRQNPRLAHENLEAGELAWLDTNVGAAAGDRYPDMSQVDR